MSDHLAKVLVPALAVALVATVTFGVLQRDDLNDTKRDLRAREDDATRAEGDLADAELQVDDLQDELDVAVAAAEAAQAGDDPFGGDGRIDPIDIATILLHILSGDLQAADAAAAARILAQLLGDDLSVLGDIDADALADLAADLGLDSLSVEDLQAVVEGILEGSVDLTGAIGDNLADVLGSARDSADGVVDGIDGVVDDATEILGELIDDIAGSDNGAGGSGGDPVGLDDLGGIDPFMMLECIDPAAVLESSGPGSGSPAADVADQVAGIVAWLERERELEFDDVPETTLLTHDEIADDVADQIERDYPASQAERDGRILGLLGAIPAGTDLQGLQGDLVSGQVAGYYDPDTGRLVVATDDPSEPLGANGLITLAHELDHALTDQALGLPDIGAGATGGTTADTDGDLGALAVVEGDASLTMTRYLFAELGLDAMLDASFDPAAVEAQDRLTTFPHFLQRQLLYPYTEGLNFVCSIFADGGWAAVDELYAEPPTSSAQIVFPDRYAASEDPVDPRDPGILSAPWTVAGVDTLGAAQLQWLFEAPGGDRDAAIGDERDRASAWAGGELRLFTDGPRSALGVALVERAGSDGLPLCDSVSAWLSATLPDAARVASPGSEVLTLDGDVNESGPDAVLTCSGSDVRIGIAPTLADARALAR